jgi:predicted permease
VPHTLIRFRRYARNDISVNDLRFALRQLRKSPGFTSVAVITLALGIGANVVVFGVVNAALLRPLDINDPQNLYQLRIGSWTNWKLLTTSYPAFGDIQQRNTTFSDIAGFYGYCQARLHWGDTVRNVSGYGVTGNYFDLLGVQPQVGRLIHAEDEHGPNSAPYIVLSDSLWRSAFNSDPRIVSTTVWLYKDPFTVIGVASARFHGTERFDWPDYYIPIVNYFDSDYLRNRTGRPLTVLGRLKRGVTAQQATENLSAISAALAREYPQTDTGLPLRLVRPGLYADTGDVIRGSLYSVTALALLVLAGACVNLTALFAARAADRRRELAVRVAVGASRWRLVRQLMTEALMISLLGGAVGLVTAALLLRVLDRGSFPSFLSNSPFSHLAVSVDAPVYVVAVILTLASALLFGMIPARTVWQSSPLQAMKSGSIDVTPLRRFSLRDLSLGAQIVICTLLVMSSLVAVRSMMRMLHVPLGFQPQGTMLAEIDLSEVEPKGDAPLEKKKAMIDAVRNVPGVAAAGAVNRVPFTGGLRGVPVFRPGTTEFTLHNSVLAPYVFTMSPGYLEAAGTRLVAGRDFSWHDTTKTPNVAIVNQTFARRMWGDAPAIGQHFFLRGDGVRGNRLPIDLIEVVGVVEDGKYHEMQESPQPVAYLSLSQNEGSYMIFVVRSQRAQKEMVPSIERSLNGIEPNAPITVQSWSEALAGPLFPARAATIALGAMGLLAAILAATGIFGIAAYNVSRRMKELGIRVALGARAKHVMTAAVGRPIVLLGVGSLVGLLMGAFGTRLLGQIVYQANPRDPVVVVGAVLTMAMLGIAASVIPARRALSVDPSKLLREE